MRFRLRRLLPLSARIALALISFGVFSGLLGLDAQQAAAAVATTTTLSSSLNPSVIGQSIVFQALVTGSNPSGTLTLTDTTTGTVIGSSGFFGSQYIPFTIYSLAIGTHQIVASYGGDSANIPSISSTLVQTVRPAGSTLALSSGLNPSPYGQPVVFTATVTAGSATTPLPTGTVTFSIDGAAQPAANVMFGTTATDSTQYLPIGSHTITASYSGDANYPGSSAPPLTQVVTAHVSPQYVSPSGSDSNSGTQSAPKLTVQAAINATLSGDTVVVGDGTYTGPGDVDLNTGGRNITVTSQNGAAATIINCAGSSATGHRGFFLGNGETNVVISGFTIENGYEGVSYGGGAIYNAINGSTIQKCTFKNNTSGSGGAIYTTIDVGTETIDSCVFSGNSAPNGGGGIFCQSSSNAVLAVVNCVLIGNSTSYNGGGIYNYNSDSSRASVTNCTFTGNTAASGGSALYTGNAASSYGSGTTSLINSIFWGDTSDELIGGFNYISNCDIQSQPNPYIGSGTTVAYTISSDPLFFSAPADLHLQALSPCRGAGIVGGTPTTTIDGRTRPNPPSMGAYEAEVTGTAATTTTLTSSLNPSAPRQSVTLTATVSGGVSPTGSVTFVEAGAPPVRVALTNGKALYTTSVLAGGPHVIKAGYSGDTSSAASISPALTQVVSFNSTSTALKSSINPAVYGQQVVLTATITGTTPTGTVTFTDVVNGFTLTYSAAVSGGVATYTSSGLIVGSHQITAAYSGDSYTSPSASAALTQIVTQAATTIAVASSLNPSIVSQDVTFTATIASAPINAMTGYVTFTVDGVVLTNAGLNMKTSVCDTSTLTAGTHTVVAAYSGDSNFAASKSSAFIQVVNPHISPLYVSPLGADSNPGTLAAPKLTLQAALNTAFSGDTVTVEDGTYTGPGNADLDFGGKNLTVASQNGAATTIIDCQGSASASHRAFYLHSGETSAIISGFTIQNGNATQGGTQYFAGGGISILNAGLTVQNCIFKNNTAGQGGGLYCSPGRNPISVINCVFTGNSAGNGGAVFDYNDGPNLLSLVNCTITGNTSTSTFYGQGNPSGAVCLGGYQSSPSMAATLTNDIVYGDTGGEIGGAVPTATYCDIQGGFAGTGNINVDPLFVSAADLRLQPASPCLGMGTTGPSVPTTTIDGITRPIPPSIGAYEVTLPSFLLNDTDSGITYNGGWFYNSGRGLGDLRDDVHATVNNGDSLSYSFLGTGVSYLTETNSDEGMVAVYIDGTLKQTVNCATPARQVQQSVYSISGLAPGLHSIKLVKVSGTVMVVDGLRITTAPGTVPMNIINDTSSALQYNGPNGANSWFHSSNRNFGDVGDDVHAATANGSSVLYSFNGTAVSYVTETNTDEGSVDVVLDNVLQTTVSCVTATRKTGQTVWSKSGLPPGPHTLLLIKHDGQYMLLDALLVTPSPTVINDTNPGLNYSAGGWFYNYGRSFGDLSDDVHATVYNGDAVSYSFTGTSISYLTETNPDEGTVAVYIDGVLNQTVSCVTPTRQVQQTVFSVSGLTPGAHTLTLVKTGGMVMVLDGLSFQ